VSMLRPLIMSGFGHRLVARRGAADLQQLDRESEAARAELGRIRTF
jgi:hypothetical protein